jgi:hypothetical protein
MTVCLVQHDRISVGRKVRMGDVEYFVAKAVRKIPISVLIHNANGGMKSEIPLWHMYLVGAQRTLPNV